VTCTSWGYRLEAGSDLGIPGRVVLTPALRPAPAGAHSLPATFCWHRGSASLPEMRGRRTYALWAAWRAWGRRRCYGGA